MEDRIQDMQNDKKRDLEYEKKRLERQLQSEWELEKSSFMAEEKETVDGQNSIISQIKDSKEKIKKLQLKIREIERQLSREKTDVEDLEMELRSKEKELRQARQAKVQSNDNYEVEELEKQLRQMDNELFSLNQKVSE